MTHVEQITYCQSVKTRHKEFFEKTTVLEIGSLNVNGSFRDLFNGCEYVGVDIVKGLAVDVVCKGHEYTSKTQFDVVCSGECFEHDEYWKKTLTNMYKLLRTGGLFFFTCASTGRAEHGTSKGEFWGTSKNYYRNLTKEDIKSVFNLEELFNDYELLYQPISKDLYFKGIKK